MSEPPYNRLDEYSSKQENRAQQGYPPQQGYPIQQGYPLAYTGNQSVGVVPTGTTIGRVTQVQPNDYLALSILVLICCCLPLGIVAVVKSSEVGTRFRGGDYDGALESSRSAKSWAMGGLIVGIVMWSIAAVIVIVYVVLIAVAVNETVQKFDYPYY